MKVVVFAVLLAIIVFISGQRVQNAITQFSESGSDTLFAISGNYCGPGWCGGKSGDYTKNACNFNAPAKDCGDACCKAHDDCCIKNRNKCGACDDAISRCLRECSCGKWDLVCKAKKVEWWAIATFFDKRGSSCC